jgi:hypothetical protein
MLVSQPYKYLPSGAGYIAIPEADLDGIYGHSLHNIIVFYHHKKPSKKVKI